jgi:transglutaminase-like putative cysteine protease
MPVSIGHSQVFLRPRDLPRQRCLSNLIDIEPRPANANVRTDYFGNSTMLYAVQEPHDRMTVSAVSEVVLTSAPPPVLQATAPWEQVREAVRDRQTPEALAALEFMFDSPLIRSEPDLTDYARPSFTPGRSVGEAALDLTQRIFRAFRYDPSTTTVSTPVSDVFAQRSGVCQDFAHLQIAMLRGLGLPARYVSGYLRTFRDADPAEPELVGADASHAWLAVYVGDGRWIDFDPTNNQVPAEHHVTLGWGRDYADVSPVKGVIIGGGEQKIEVRVNVEPI